MSSLMRQPVLGQTTHRLGSNRPRYVDPEIAAMLRQADEDGYRRGLVDGAARISAAAAEERDRSLAALRQATESSLANLRSTLIEGTQEALQFGLDLAEIICGHTPHDGGVSIAGRVTAALDQMDEESVTLIVSPADETMFTDAYSLDGRVTVVASNKLAPGEALLQGRWAEADLTTSSIRQILEASLHD